MDVESLAKELILKGMTDEQQKAVLDSIKGTMETSRQLQKQRVGEQATLVIQALKKIESDITSRYDELGNKIVNRVESIKDGIDGKNGRDGVNGRDGRAGRDGAQGPKGADGINGANGQDGVDGVSVTDAHIDFDGSLIINLSSGQVLNVGEVVAPDLVEKIKVITNGGGTSQGVLDTLESLQYQINSIIIGGLPTQTGNAGKFLTTDGTNASWATVGGGGGGAVDSVNGQTGTVVLTTTNISEGTRLYYTDARTRAAISAGTGISYSSATGIVTNSAPDQTVALTAGTGISATGTYPNFTVANTAPDRTVVLTQAGTTTVSGTYPNFTISSADQFAGTVTSVGGTGTVNGLSLSGTVTSSGSLTLSGTLSGTASGLTAGNVTTNANLTGAITSVGNATSLGSFTSEQLATALTDETGTGAVVLSNSPVLVTPSLGTPSNINLSNATNLPQSLINISTSLSAPAFPSGSLWFDSDYANLFINYNDGDSTQWVAAAPGPTGISFSSFDGGSAMVNSYYAISLINGGAAT